jgi:dTDP-4-dehydrorhamnose 3,5-epimerase
MIFTETKLPGAYIIDVELKADPRGLFARTFCAQEFEKYGLKTNTSQCHLSFNHQKGTLRGFHYQTAPAAETKLVRCTQGAIYDVIIDMRPESPTYLEHIGVELSAENRRALYVPEMFAHAYQTLTDNAEVIYQVSGFYAPEYEKGIQHRDPFFAIEWPLVVTVISDKDAACPLFKPNPAEVLVQ